MSGPLVFLAIVALFFALGMLAGRSRQASSNSRYHCPVCACCNYTTEERGVGVGEYEMLEYRSTFSCGFVRGFTGLREAFCGREQS